MTTLAPVHPTPIMDRLRDSTAELHRHAESRTLQRDMARGTVDRPTLARYLSQLFLVHSALESRLAQLVATRQRLEELFKADQHRAADLRADLHISGVEAATVAPLPATRTLIEHIESVDSIALLGMLYVLEGSMNGNRFIVRSLMKAFGTTDGAGLSYFNPYGEGQPQRWQQFKDAMNTASLVDDDVEGIIDAARIMFESLARISDDVLAAPHS
jgi:heme oxygenase